MNLSVSGQRAGSGSMSPEMTPICLWKHFLSRGVVNWARIVDARFSRIIHQKCISKHSCSCSMCIETSLTNYVVTATDFLGGR